MTTQLPLCFHTWIDDALLDDDDYRPGFYECAACGARGVDCQTCGGVGGVRHGPECSECGGGGVVLLDAKDKTW